MYWVMPVYWGDTLRGEMMMGPRLEIGALCGQGAPQPQDRERGHPDADHAWRDGVGGAEVVESDRRRVQIVQVERHGDVTQRDLVRSSAR